MAIRKWGVIPFLLVGLAGCSKSPSMPKPTGRGGEIVASISNSANSNVDTNPFRGVSNGGGESIGGDYLEIDAVDEITMDLLQGINLRINESSSYNHWWTPAVGTIPLGTNSPVQLDYLEQLTTDTIFDFRDWIAIDGTLEVTALSTTAISYRIH